MSHISIFIAIKDPFADWWIFTFLVPFRKCISYPKFQSFHKIPLKMLFHEYFLKSLKIYILNVKSVFVLRPNPISGLDLEG